MRGVPWDLSATDSILEEQQQQQQQQRQRRQHQQPQLRRKAWSGPRCPASVLLGCAGGATCGAFASAFAASPQPLPRSTAGAGAAVSAAAASLRATPSAARVAVAAERWRPTSHAAQQTSSSVRPHVAVALAMATGCVRAIQRVRAGASRRCSAASSKRTALRGYVDEEVNAIEASGIVTGLLVRVVDDTELTHVPGHKNKPFNVKGFSGVVRSVQIDPQLSANRPVLVKLSKNAGGEDVKNFDAHFCVDELEIVDGGLQAAASADSDVVAAALVGARLAPSAVEAASAEAAPSAGSSAVATVVAATEAHDPWLITLMYDSECPLCMKQVELLEKRVDENPEYAGLIRLTDLHAPGYDPKTCGGVVFEDGMRHLHAVTRDGDVVTGMEVFRRVYSIVGMEWVFNITTVPLLGAIFDWGYDLWAEYRLILSGRHDILERIEKHKQNIQALAVAECDVECEIDWDNPWAIASSPVPISK
mmetsp:Transcript_10605/g.27479  ORF Transcript_10605/g.27479 Transcript_10605/m.27479 type:complete len:477 (-) Transcript_10605:126-1556(-)